MTFAIITFVPHIIEQNQYFAYAPYVREMNIWIKDLEQISIVAPISKTSKTLIDANYQHQNIDFIPIESFDIKSAQSIFKAIFKIPRISWRIYWAMKKADHIHLRCPGNISLLGCLVQILFPSKTKTAKYAGNWDLKAKQPWSYRMQKWILSNTFLTRNMQVLVYGEWEGSSKNIKPFFTATYTENEKTPILNRSLGTLISFVFVGTLVRGKNPLYAIQLVELLQKKGANVVLDLYGEGVERQALEQYIEQNNLEKIVLLKGNQSLEVVKKTFQSSHFVLLPSVSEGWPKAIAEGMFWGCVPLATSVSCVPFMLDFGNRGLLLEMNLEKDALQIEALIKNPSDFNSKSQKASGWSRKYTLDFFEDEIKKLVQP